MNELRRWRGLPAPSSCAFAVLLALLACAPRLRADDAPPWLRDVLARPAAMSETQAGAVVLESEEHVSILESGRIAHGRRTALRVLTREGAAHATATAYYRTDAGRVRDFRAWLATPSGEVRALPSALVVDAAVLGNDLYNEVRLRHLNAGDVPPGAVFAYEWLVEQDEPFAQLEHLFQDELPVLVSRFVLDVPAGWSVAAGWVNHAPVEPALAGPTRTWELRDLAEIQDEPLRPDSRGLVPRLDVTATPPAGRSHAAITGFSSWHEVARWLDGLATSAGAPDEAVRAQSQRLVAGARSELDTLRALGRFVQGLRYASIQMGVGRGGGYLPRAPGTVLSRAYGDCKDKANLLRNLLAAVGHPAFLLSLYLGDPDHVRAAWPSPAPFNHCITAIPLRASLGLPSEVADPRHGRLLIFDPTDSETPIGDLSTQTQGGLGLVIATDTDSLTRLPELPPDASTVERRFELTLDDQGDTRGTLTERCRGQAAVAERRYRTELASRDYRNSVVKWLRTAIASAEIETFEVRDDTLAGRFETTIQFQARRLGQSMGGGLLVIRPPLLSRLGRSLSTDRPRRHPVALNARAVRETLIVHAPDGFVVDESPPEAAFDGPLARFEARTEASGEGFLQTRALVVRRGEVGVDRFDELRAFFERVRAAEEAPTVLARR